MPRPHRLAAILLLSIAPFAWFYAGNLHEPIGWGDLALYAFCTSAFALALVVTLEALPRSRPGRAAGGVAVAVFLFFHYHGMANAGVAIGYSPDSAALLYGGVALGAIAIGTLLGTRRGFQQFLLVFSLINLAVPTVLIAIDRNSTERERTRPPLEHGLAGNDVWSGTPQPEPNAYGIVVDSYPNARDLLDFYGFDNRVFVDDLHARGFTVIPDSYANYSTTLLSVPSTLEMDYVFDQEDPVYEVPRAGSWRRLPGLTRSGVNASIGGDNRSVSFFRALGYRYLHYEGGLFLVTRCQGTEDVCLEGGSTGLSDLDSRLVALTPLQWFFSNLDAFPVQLRPRTPAASGTGIPELREDLEERPLPEPFFLYAHIASPHRPYTNDALCNLLPLEFDRSGNRHFLAQLQCVNLQLLELLDSIVERDPEAIVLVSADHGPRLSVRKGTSLYALSKRQLRESLSILQAYRAPPECLASLTTDLAPVNSLRWVFACLGNEPPRWKPQHHFIARSDSPERGRVRKVSLD